MGVSPVPGGDGGGVGLQEHSAAGETHKFQSQSLVYTLSPLMLIKVFTSLFRTNGNSALSQTMSRTERIYKNLIRHLKTFLLF